MENKGNRVYLELVKNVLIIMIMLLSLQSMVAAAQTCNICRTGTLKETTYPSGKYLDGSRHITKIYKCSNCGFDKSETVGHSWRLTSINSDEHQSTCSCGAKGSKTEHVFEVNKRTPPGSTGHTLKCACGSTKIEKHQTKKAADVNCGTKFDPSYCDKCGYTSGTAQIFGQKHNYKTIYVDETYHVEKCVCGSTRGKSEHSYKYLSLNNNEHMEYCAGCTYTKTEEHVRPNALDIDCGVEYNPSECMKCGWKAPRNYHNSQRSKA